MIQFFDVHVHILYIDVPLIGRHLSRFAFHVCMCVCVCVLGWAVKKPYGSELWSFSITIRNQGCGGVFCVQISGSFHSFRGQKGGFSNTESVGRFLLLDMKLMKCMGIFD